MKRIFERTDEGIEILPVTKEGTAIDVSEEVKEDQQDQQDQQEQPKIVVAEQPSPSTNGKKETQTETQQETGPKSVDPSVFDKKEDVEEEVGEGIKIPDVLADMTARQMSEYVTGLIATYVPKMMSEKCKVNINNVMFHQAQGLLPPVATDLFSKINIQVERDLQVDSAEQKMLVTTFLPLVKIYNINERPELAALVALSIFFFNKWKNMNDYRKANEKMLADFMKNYLEGLAKIAKEQKQKAT